MINADIASSNATIVQAATYDEAKLTCVIYVSEWLSVLERIAPDRGAMKRADAVLVSDG